MRHRKSETNREVVHSLDLDQLATGPPDFPIGGRELRVAGYIFVPEQEVR